MAQQKGAKRAQKVLKRKRKQEVNRKAATARRLVRQAEQPAEVAES